jgi:hypothetical protein
LISERTKAALAQSKKPLGTNSHKNPQRTIKALQRAQQVKSEKARAKAAAVMPAIKDARKLGCTSLSAIARKLNEFGKKAPRGGLWSAAQVKALFERFDPLS